MKLDGAMAAMIYSTIVQDTHNDIKGGAVKLGSSKVLQFVFVFLSLCLCAFVHLCSHTMTRWTAEQARKPHTGEVENGLRARL